jgi:hypothetical protein
MRQIGCGLPKRYPSGLMGGEEVSVGSVDEVHRRVRFGELSKADGDHAGVNAAELVGDLVEPPPDVVDARV